MSDSAPSRRELLSGCLAVAATATAGCLGSQATTDDDAARTLRLVLSREDGPLRDRFVVDLSETDPDRDEDAFAAVLDGETYTTRQRPPFRSTPEDPTYARHDGTYYRLGSVVVDEVTAVRPVLRLSAVDGSGGGSTPGGSAGAVAAAALPAADQRAVRVAYFAARARGNVGGVPWGLVQRGGYVYRNEDAVAASALLAEDGPARVTYRDATYAVDVAREEFHEPVYRATADPVAEAPERMEAVLRAQFVDARFGRAELSAAAREVLAAARRDGYAEPHPYSDGYRAVLRRLHARAYLDGNVEKDSGVGKRGRRMLRYDGTYYDYWLRFTAGDA